MLKKLTLENFRNITEEIEIQFSKITLLFGMNNVGKSSIVNALDIINNIDSKFDVSLKTNLANYGSIENLYSKHNTKKYFKIKFQVDKLKRKDDKIDKFEYEIKFFDKNKKTEKHIKNTYNEKIISELKVNGDNDLYFENLKNNETFNDEIENFFHQDHFKHEYFKKKIYAVLNQLPSVNKYFQYVLYLNVVLDEYNQENQDDMHINHSDIINHLRALNSSKKYSLQNFFNKIEKDEDNIEDKLFDIFKKNYQNTSKYKINDFDYLDNKNKKLALRNTKGTIINFRLISCRAFSLFKLAFNQRDLDEVKDKYSISEKLLFAIFKYHYCETFLMGQIVENIRNIDFPPIFTTRFEEQSDYLIYENLIKQFQKFTTSFLSKNNIDKKILIENFYTYPSHLESDSFINLFGRRQLWGTKIGDLRIVTIFQRLSENVKKKEEKKRVNYLHDFDLHLILSDFFKIMPITQIYLGEDTYKRVFTYNNSKSFNDLLYDNRDNKNLLTKISNDVNKLGFDINEIIIETQDNSYWIKVSSSKSITDLVDCGKGIKKIISILTQIYCNKLNDRFSMIINPNLVCIEEPESNIHPKIQSELGSMINSAIQQNIAKQLVIETHSENLTLRLLKLIREKKLRSDDVAINCLYLDEKNIVRTKKMNIHENGDIIDNWPGGFFEEALNEII